MGICTRKSSELLLLDCINFEHLLALDCLLLLLKKFLLYEEAATEYVL